MEYTILREYPENTQESRQVFIVKDEKGEYHIAELNEGPDDFLCLDNEEGPGCGDYYEYVGEEPAIYNEAVYIVEDTCGDRFKLVLVYDDQATGKMLRMTLTPVE
jgi:hypothetical protein